MVRRHQKELERLTLSISEAARVLGIGKNKCYELARAGRLPVIRLGKQWLVPVSALERWLESVAKGGGAE